jgi:hypothetical protein
MPQEPSTDGRLESVLAVFDELAQPDKQTCFDKIRSRLQPKNTKWITLEETAKMLGKRNPGVPRPINRSTIWRYIKSGRLVTNGKQRQECRILRLSVDVELVREMVNVAVKNRRVLAKGGGRVQADEAISRFQAGLREYEGILECAKALLNIP